MNIHHIILTTFVHIENSSLKKKAHIVQAEPSHWIKNKLHIYMYSIFQMFIYIIMIDKIQIHLKKNNTAGTQWGQGPKGWKAELD